MAGYRKWPGQLIRSMWGFCIRVVSMIGILLVILFLYLYLCIAPKLGNTVGKALGSWRGVAQGIEKGLEEGKKAGLSAEDTVVEIKNKVTAQGDLQVLLVDLQLTDLYQQGKSYAMLLGLKGEGVFTVDLAQSKTTFDEGQRKITILIPDPVFTPYLHDSSLEVIAKYPQRKWDWFDGSTADGYHGYLNSLDQIDKRVQEEMTDYDRLMEQAREAALEQVGKLARTLCGGRYLVEVRFAEERG